MGVSAVVGIPWRPQRGRLEAFEATRAFYEDANLEVVAEESPFHVSRPFNAAASRNHLVNELHGNEVIVLSDADTVPDAEVLWRTIDWVARHGRTALPYHLYRRDKLDGSSEFIPGACSGIIVTTAQDWWKSTNGQDEAFEGWGFEDAAWLLAYTTLRGPLHREHGTIVATDHERPDQRRQRNGHLIQNQMRHRAYRAAYGNPEAMRALTRGER